MKKNFKNLLCSVLVLGTTVAIGLFAAGCNKDDFKNKVDQAFCDHNYGVLATKTVREASCTVEGEELWTCIECGKEKTVVLDKLEHDFSVSKGGWTKTKQASTCREEGVQESRCGVCKTIVTVSIAKLPHTEVSVEQKLPTCTIAGHTEYTYCSACNDFVTPKVTIPALGHNVKIVEGYEATCDSKGLTNGKVCLDCDEVLTEQKDIPALGHKIEYLAPVEPTCEMTGLTAGYACVRCDKVYTAQNVVEKLPHVDEDKDGYCDECYSLSSIAVTDVKEGMDLTGYALQLRGDKEEFAQICLEEGYDLSTFRIVFTESFVHHGDELYPFEIKGNFDFIQLQNGSDYPSLYDIFVNGIVTDDLNDKEYFSNEATGYVLPAGLGVVSSVELGKYADWFEFVYVGLENV